MTAQECFVFVIGAFCRGGIYNYPRRRGPAKHGIYPLDFLVHLISLWSLPARMIPVGRAKNFVFPLRLIFFTAKGAKELRPPERVVRAGKGR